MRQVHWYGGNWPSLDEPRPHFCPTFSPPSQHLDKTILTHFVQIMKNKRIHASDENEHFFFKVPLLPSSATQKKRAGGALPTFAPVGSEGTPKKRMRRAGAPAQQQRFYNRDPTDQRTWRFYLKPRMLAFAIGPIFILGLFVWGTYSVTWTYLLNQLADSTSLAYLLILLFNGPMAMGTISLLKTTFSDPGSVPRGFDDVRSFKPPFLTLLTLSSPRHSPLPPLCSHMLRTLLSAKGLRRAKCVTAKLATISSLTALTTVR